MESWEIKKWGLVGVGIVIAVIGLAYGTETKAVEVATQTTYSYSWPAFLGGFIGVLLVFVGCCIDEGDC